jgi:hypothetical protein
LFWPFPPLQILELIVYRPAGGAGSIFGRRIRLGGKLDLAGYDQVNMYAPDGGWNGLQTIFSSSRVDSRTEACYSPALQSPGFCASKGCFDVFRTHF